MSVAEVLNIRKSVRSYTGAPVTDDQLSALLAAAYAAPVGMGKYETIHLTVITNQEILDEIDANGAAFFGNPDIHPLYGAPLLIVVSSSEDGNVASANVAMIVHNMALEAVELGIGHVDIYGATAGLAANKALVDKIGIPAGFTPLGAIAAGPTDETYEAREIGVRFETNTIA